MSDDDRLEHLRSLGPTLWPGSAWQTTRTGRSPRVGDPRGRDGYVLLPSAGRPRLLVPSGRRAAAAFVRHHGEGRKRSARVLATGSALVLRTGLGPLLWRDRLQVVRSRTGEPTLVEHLSAVLNTEVVIGLHLGAPRANRKPVIQVLSPTGRPLAYAKLGVDALTDRLVEHEAETLRFLTDVPMAEVQAPAVRHHGSWHGHPLLLQSALPVWQRRRRADETRLANAATEVAATCGISTRPLAGTEYFGELRQAVAVLPADTDRDRLRTHVERLGDDLGAVPLALGASHGDWTPWNMAMLEDAVLVWDWERFRRQAPLGFDLLHHGLQADLVVRMADPSRSARTCVSAAPVRLRALGLSHRTAQAVALLYLVDLAVRYLADRQREAGARLGDVGAWLLPQVEWGLGAWKGAVRR